MSVMTRLFAEGRAYMEHPPGEEEDTNNPWWAENVAAQIEVERSDDNEVKLAISLAGDEGDAASFYLTDAEATRFALMLGKVVIER